MAVWSASALFADRWCHTGRPRILGHTARVPTGVCTGAIGEAGCHRGVRPPPRHRRSRDHENDPPTARPASRPLRGADRAHAHGGRRRSCRHWSRRRGFELACRPDRAVSRAAPCAARPFPGATSSSGCRTPLPRPGTCAGAPRSAPARLARRPRRDAVRAELPAADQPVRATRSLLRGLPLPQRVHADAPPRRSTGPCSCGSTAVGSPRMAPATTTAPSSQRTASSSSRSTTGSARSGSLPIRRSPGDRVARPATTA